MGRLSNGRTPTLQTEDRWCQWQQKLSVEVKIYFLVKSILTGFKQVWKSLLPGLVGSGLFGMRSMWGEMMGSSGASWRKTPTAIAQSLSSSTNVILQFSWSDWGQTLMEMTAISWLHQVGSLIKMKAKIWGWSFWRWWQSQTMEGNIGLLMAGRKITPLPWEDHHPSVAR